MPKSNRPQIQIEEQFRIMADTAPVLIWISGTDKLCYFFNAGWFRFTGRTMDQEYGNGWLEGIHPDDFHRWTDVYNGSFDAQKEFQIQYRLKRHDGQYCWLVGNAVPRFEADGSFGGYVGSCMDIDNILESERVRDENIYNVSLEKEQSLNEELAAANEELSSINEELKQSEESLRINNEDLEQIVEDRMLKLSESEGRFRNMAESTDVLIAVSDESGNGIYFNKAWVSLTGKTEQELAEFGWAQLIHPDDKERWLGNYLVAAKNQESISGEFRIRSKGGDYRWLLASIPARFRRDSSFAGYISSCVDITDRKTGELHLEQIINILPAAVVVIRGPELIAERINKANLSYWNKTKEEVIGKPLLEILPELADQPFPGQLRHVMQTGEIIDIKESPVLLVNDDGTERKSYVDYTYQPLVDVNGERNGVLVMSFEITNLVEQRLLLEQYGEEMQAMNEELTSSNEELAAVNEELITAHQRVEESELAMRLAIDAANFGTWFIHSVTREFITDDRLKELFGYYPDEHLSIEQALAQVTDEYRTHVSAALENAIYKGGDYDVTYPVVGFHDEKLRWLRAIGNLKADASGAFSAFTGVVMDITEQVLAAQKIQQADERLRMAVNAGELASWQLNEGLGKIIASPRFNELFGFQEDEEVPFTAAVMQILPEYQQMFKDAVLASFANGAHFTVEYPIVGFNNGKQRWVRSVGKLVNDDKNGNYLIGVMADITEQKMDEIRKNDFIGMVSHELKTPLTSLTLGIQMLEFKFKNNEDTFLTSTLNKAGLQVKRMNGLINGFLNVSRLESSKLQIDKQPFDLTKLIIETIEETVMANTIHNIVFEQSEPFMVHADKDKIGSVISNLLSNAVKYSPHGTFINIYCHKEDDKAIVCIKDEGLGIRKEDVEKIFSRYYRVEDNRKKFISGFGIGLYLCSEIIQRHHGKIWVESEFGAGSVFCFSIPLKQAEEVPQ